MSANPTPSSSDVSTPPRKVREYELIEQLGQGGMGTVYKATHTMLKREVAIKLLPAERMNDEDSIMRFRREMEAVGKLRHPNIVQAHDAGEERGTHFLVMEYVAGYDLTKVQHAVGPLQAADACELIRQAAVGLQHAHEHQMVHRDIKPSNLLLTPEGHVKVLDLGLALLQSEIEFGRNLTSTGQIMGTLDFIAPEQVDDTHAVDIRADIYSLGCTLYSLLSGKAPFASVTQPLKKMWAHGNKPLPPIAAVRNDLPANLQQVIEMMTAKEPAARFSTPGEVVDALTPFTASCDLAGLYDTVRRADPSAVENSRKREVNMTFESGTTMVAGVEQRESDFAAAVAPTSDRLQPLAPAPKRLGDTVDVQATHASPSAMTNRRWRSVLLLLVIPFLVAAWFAAPQIIRIATGKGQLVIETKDEDILVTVRQNGAQIVDQKTDRMYDLKVGEYEIELTEKPDGVKLLTRKISITRGGKEVVDVKLELAKQEADPRIPVTTAPRPPLVDVPYTKPVSNQSLVPRPTQIAGLETWTIETLGHRGLVNSIAAHPNGKWVVTAGGHDGSVRIWDVTGGRLVAVLNAHEASNTSARWSPDGKMLATAAFDGLIKLWQFGEQPDAGGRFVARLTTTLAPPTDDRGWIYGIAWSPDRKRIAATGGGKIYLWNVESESPEIARVDGHCYSPTWSPTGENFAAVSQDGELLVFESEPLQLKTRVNLGFPVKGLAVAAWSPDNRRIAIGTATSQMVLIDAEKLLATDQAVHKTAEEFAADTIAVGNKFITTCGWSRDGRTMLICTAAKAVVWDMDRGQALHEHESRQDAVATWLPGNRFYSVAFHTADAQINGTAIQSCDCTSGQVLRTFPEQGSTNAAMSNFSISPDGTELWCGSYFGVQRCSVANGQGRIDVPKKSFFVDVSPSTAAHPAGRVASSWGPDLSMLFADSTATPRHLKRQPEAIDRVAWSPDADRFATASRDGFVRIWNAESLELTKEWETEPSDVNSYLLWSTDGRYVAFAKSDFLAVYDLSDASAVNFDSLPGRLEALVISPIDEAPFLAVFFVDGRSVVHPVDVKAQGFGKVFDGWLRGGMTSLSWSPNKQWLAIGRQNSNELNFRRINDPKKFTVTAPSARLTDLDWTNDSRRILGLAHEESRIQAWEVFPPDADPRTADPTPRRLGTMIAGLPGGDWVTIGPDGHYRGTEGIENHLVYVAVTPEGAMTTLTPQQFAERYGWRNDPAKAYLAGE